MANTFKLDTNADLTTNAISDAAAVILTTGASATNIHPQCSGFEQNWSQRQR